MEIIIGLLLLGLVGFVFMIMKTSTDDSKRIKALEDAKMKRITEQETQLQQKDAELKKMTEERQKLEDEFFKAKDDAEIFKRENTDLLAKVKQLDKQKEEYASLKDDVKQKEALAHQETVARQKMEGELSLKETELAKIEKERDQLKGDLKAKTDLYEGLKGQYEELEAEILKLREAQLKGKAEAPKTGASGSEVKAEVLKSELPKVEAPKADPQKIQKPEDNSKPQEPKAELSKADVSKAELSRTEVPKAEAPKWEAAKAVELPKTDTAKTEAPKTEAPKAEIPKPEPWKADDSKLQSPVDEPRPQTGKPFSVANAPKPELPKAAESKTEPAKPDVPKAELRPELPKAAEAPKPETPKIEPAKTAGPAIDFMGKLTPSPEIKSETLKETSLELPKTDSLIPVPPKTEPLKADGSGIGFPGKKTPAASEAKAEPAKDIKPELPKVEPVKPELPKDEPRKDAPKIDLSDPFSLDVGVKKPAVKPAEPKTNEIPGFDKVAETKVDIKKDVPGDVEFFKVNASKKQEDKPVEKPAEDIPFKLTNVNRPVPPAPPADEKKETAEPKKAEKAPDGPAKSKSKRETLIPGFHPKEKEEGQA